MSEMKKWIVEVSTTRTGTIKLMAPSKKEAEYAARMTYDKEAVDKFEDDGNEWSVIDVEEEEIMEKCERKEIMEIFIVLENTDTNNNYSYKRLFTSMDKAEEVFCEMIKEYVGDAWVDDYAEEHLDDGFFEKDNYYLEISSKALDEGKN